MKRWCSPPCAKVPSVLLNRYSNVTGKQFIEAPKRRWDRTKKRKKSRKESFRGFGRNGSRFLLLTSLSTFTPRCAIAYSTLCAIAYRKKNTGTTTKHSFPTNKIARNKL